MARVRCPCPCRLCRLAQNRGAVLGARHLSCKFSNKMAFKMSMCILTAQASAKGKAKFWLVFGNISISCEAGHPGHLRSGTSFLHDRCRTSDTFSGAVSFCETIVIFDFGHDDDSVLQVRHFGCLAPVFLWQAQYVDLGKKVAETSVKRRFWHFQC